MGVQTVSHDLLIILGSCLTAALLAGYLIKIRPSIRNRRVRKVEHTFESNLATSRRCPTTSSRSAIVSSIRQVDDVVRRGKQRISSLAPVVPPADNGVSDTSELRSAMIDCLQEDYKGWALGGSEEFLYAILQISGHSTPELLVQVLESIKNRVAEHPGEILTIGTHILRVVAKPSVENTDQLIEYCQGFFEPHEMLVIDGAELSGFVTDGGSDALGVDFSGVPVITAFRSFLREYSLLDKGRTTPTRALKNVSLDVSGTGIGGLIGTFLIPIPIVGTVVGAVLLRSLTDHFKRGPYRKALKAYESGAASAKPLEAQSMRKMYRGYRDKALELTTVFRSELEDFCLPSESPAMKAIAADIRRAAKDDCQLARSEVRSCAEATLGSHDDTWYDHLLGLAISPRLRTILDNRVQRELGVIDARYLPLIEAGDSIVYCLERASRTPLAEGGALVDAIEQGTVRINTLLHQCMEDFVLWSGKAKILHQQSLQRLIETIKEESTRHSREMDEWINRLRSLKEAVDLEAGRLGA